MEYEKDIRKHPQISELEYRRSLLSMCEAERRDIESRLLKADENKRIDKKLIESIVGVLGKTGYEKCEKLRKNLQRNIESIDTESLTEIEYKCKVRKIEKKFKNKYLNLACKYSFNSAKLSNIISHFDDTYATGSAAFPPVPVPVSSDKNCVGKVDTLLPPFSPGSMNFSDPSLPDNNGQAAYTNYLDNYTGEFGGYSDIETYHRHEIARSEVHLIAALRFYYKIPTTGQIKIRCQFEITRDKSDIDPRPAPRGWWWNKRNYEVQHKTNIYARVIHPELSNATNLFKQVRRENKGGKKVLFPSNNPGNRIETPCRVVPGAIAGGEWIIVELGVETINKTYANDFYIDSTLAFSGLFRKIEIGSTGDR